MTNKVVRRVTKPVPSTFLQVIANTSSLPLEGGIAAQPASSLLIKHLRGDVAIFA